MELSESILISIKKLLGIDKSYTHFDADIIMHINSVFSILAQMGVGPSNGFSISGSEEKLADFIADSSNTFSLVKSYIHLKVKLLFDPPLSSAAVDSINRQISEFEWRLFVAADQVEEGVDVYGLLQQTAAPAISGTPRHSRPEMGRTKRSALSSWRGGGDYTPSEKKAILGKRKRGNSIYNKRHFDEVLKADKATPYTEDSRQNRR